jgi:D-alanyl-D-alanine carboxypeptidase
MRLLELKSSTGQPFNQAIFMFVVAAMVLLAPVQSAEAKYASLVLDAETGKVLHAVNADTRNYPASLTKMMTIYMVFHALERGDITPDTKWKASARAIRQPASKLGMTKGQAVTVRDAVMLLITKSANDVATLIAENMAGSEREFALAMTATARSIGMSRTTFRNASGLPNKGQLSTARDMATLALALLRDFPRYYHLFSTAKFKYDDRTYKNHNKLLASYEGTDGIKTGYIRASGYNLVASVKRNGKRLIGVVFGGDSSKMRNRHMVKLLDKGFRLLNDNGMAMASTSGTTSGSVASATTPTVVASAGNTSGKYGWAIQVGAFANEDHAGRVAEEAATIVPKIMTNGFVTVVPLTKKSGKLLYRSRIHGITKGQAYRACKVLEKRKINCMEVRLPKEQQVAQAASN